MIILKRSPLFYLALITLFAFIVRFWGFWIDAPHVDEVFTIELLNHSLRYIIQYTLTTDCNPPLFYLIDWVSVHLFGFNTFGQRLPSVIFGTLLIPAVYVLGKEFRDEKLGLLSALAMATLGSMWYYSGFGRTYMLNCLLFACFAVYVLRVLKGKDRRLSWIGIIACTSALAYAHLFSVIATGTILFLVLFESRERMAIRFWNIVRIIIICSPLSFLFYAVLTTRAPGKEAVTGVWNWWGVTPDQIFIWGPLEFFNYTAFIWIPLIVYAVWRYRAQRFVQFVTFSFFMSLSALVFLSNITPVFIRYIILFVPVLCTIALSGIIDFWEEKESVWPYVLKRNLIYSLIVFYIACELFAIIFGFYAPKGHL